MPTFNEDFLIRANLTAETITAQSGNFSSAWLTTLDQVDPVNNVFQFPVYYAQEIGSVVATATADVFIATEVCNLASFKVFNSTAPTGGDKAFTVDLQKSTGGGAFATILSAVITRNSSDTDRTTETATISSAALIAGDVLRVVVTASGSTGTQGSGVTAQIMVEQNGQ